MNLLNEEGDLKVLKMASTRSGSNCPSRVKTHNWSNLPQCDELHQVWVLKFGLHIP
jgi:hypothetical protein